MKSLCEDSQVNHVMTGDYQVEQTDVYEEYVPLQPDLLAEEMAISSDEEGEKEETARLNKLVYEKEEPKNNSCDSQHNSLADEPSNTSTPIRRCENTNQSSESDTEEEEEEEISNGDPKQTVKEKLIPVDFSPRKEATIPLSYEMKIKMTTEKLVQAKRDRAQKRRSAQTTLDRNVEKLEAELLTQRARITASTEKHNTATSLELHTRDEKAAAFDEDEKNKLCHHRG